MHPGDAELVARSVSGDAEAFGVLVGRYQGAVYATAYYYAGRYGAAEDIAQESFWAAYRSLRQLNNPGEFGAWLKGITTRTAANWLRKNLSRVRSEVSLPPRVTLSFEDGGRGPETEATAAEELERVFRAVDALPERYRLPVILRYMQELSHEEIARFTGETPEEVRGVLHRALAQLREALGDTQKVRERTWRRANG